MMWVPGVVTVPPVEFSPLIDIGLLLSNMGPYSDMIILLLRNIRGRKEKKREKNDALKCRNLFI